MNTASQPKPCERAEITCAYALQALPAGEIPGIEAHIAACPDCQRELESLRSVIKRFVAWPTDLLRPPVSLRERLGRRIADETGKAPLPSPAQRWSEPDWEQVAPGIECKLLASDTERRGVSMLVRLAPGASYPVHTHAGGEELHLLEGSLWIDERQLVAGDYNYSPPRASDTRVWTETGCTCLLVEHPGQSALTTVRLPDIAQCGLPGINRIPFGTHACHFYRNRDELAAALVPYFLAGLRSNERCLWVTAPPLTALDAVETLCAAWDGARDAVRTDALRILDFAEWYASSRRLKGPEVAQLWLAEEERALADGFHGLRITGNASFLTPDDWPTFMRYEEGLSGLFEKRRILALCSYALAKCTDEQMSEVVRAHHCVLERLDTSWRLSPAFDHPSASS